MEKKTTLLLIAAVTTAAAGVGAGIYFYNKKKEAEANAEVLANQLADADYQVETAKEAMAAMEDDRSRMLAILQSYKNEKEAAVESMKEMYDAAKEENVFEYYEKHVKGTDIGDRIETKYDVDKKAIEEDMKADAEEFVNEYQKRLQEISDETGVDITLERHMSYGGHDLAAEEEGSNWQMPDLEEIDEDPAWYEPPRQPNKSGRVDPYQISNLTFTQDQDYQKVAVFYYPMMERLEDEEGAKIEIDDSISWMALTWFGSDPEDQNRIYVRNQEKKIDYEVIQIN